jgi:hypothetical protein
MRYRDLTDFANFTFKNARRDRNCSTGTAIVGTAPLRRAGFRMPISGIHDGPDRDSANNRTRICRKPYLRVLGNSSTSDV